MLPIALPLAPGAGAGAVATGTLILGSGAYIADQLYGFRRDLPPLPRVGGKAGGATMPELIADALAAARVGVASVFPPPFTPPPFLQAGRAIATALAAQIWGLLGSRPSSRFPADIAHAGFATGTVPPKGATVGGVLTADCISGGTTVYISTDCKQTSWIAPSGNGRVWSEANVVAVRYAPTTAGCGINSLQWELTDGTGRKYFKTLQQTTRGFKEVGSTWVFGWSGPGGVPFLPDVEAAPLPGGWKPPQVKPAEGALFFPFPIGRPDPFAPLEPDAEPAGVPIAPGPERPAVPGVGVPRPVYVPVGIPGSLPIRDGQVVPPAPAPIPVTPSDVVFPVPGGKPVGGPAQSPQATLTGIAQEVGRIERKMEGLLNPKGDGNPVADWLDQLDDYWDAFQRISDLLTSVGGGGEYALREACDPDGDGVFVERKVPYAGALGPLGVIENKIDALAGLMQAAKDLRQPVCPPPETVGEGVTIHFASLLTPPGDRHKLQKLFRYNDQSRSPLEVHHDHWVDFTWQSGPVMVISDGLKWGRPRVWAVTLEEGKRVLRHAAAVAGVNLADPRHKWVHRTVADPRYGRRETMEVKRLNHGLRAITKRPGPDGPIWVIAD